MNKDKELKDKYGTAGGWKIPEGFFDEVFAKISSELPAYPEAPKKMELSRWQRVKPYIYMAAMFAGIWLMMNVFHRVSSNHELNLDNPPAAIAQAMSNQDVVNSVLFSDTRTDFELEAEISDEYDNIEDFERDFGYDLKPQYANISIN